MAFVETSRRSVEREGDKRPEAAIPARWEYI
jgi:hypothetical protein